MSDVGRDAAASLRGDRSSPWVEARALLIVAAPLSAAHLAEMAMGFTDMAVVGRLGSLELAAVGLSANILFGFLFVCTGLVSIVGVLVSEAEAAGQRERAGHAVRQGLWVALAVSLPATWVGWNMAPLLRLFGQEEAVVVLAEQYTRAAVWCFLPYMWFTTLRNFVAALARAGSVLVISVAAVALNLGANYVLVFGKLGFPALGVAGSGYASSIVTWGMFVALLGYCVRERGLSAYRVLAKLGRIDLRLCRTMLRLGLPVSGMWAVDTVLFSTVAILMGWLGAATLAANQIAYSFWNLVIVVPWGLTLAATYRVAHGVGRRDVGAARRAGFIAMGAGGAYMIPVGLAMWLLPEAIAAIYLDTGDPANAEVLAVARGLLSIAAVFLVVDGVQLIAAGALRGLKDTAVPFAIGLVGYWLIGLAGGYLLAFEAGYGAFGLWWGLAAGLGAAAVPLVWRFHRLTRAPLGQRAPAAT